MATCGKSCTEELPNGTTCGKGCDRFENHSGGCVCPEGHLF